MWQKLVPCDALFHLNVNGILVVTFCFFARVVVVIFVIVWYLLFWSHKPIGSLGSSMPRDPIHTGTVVPTVQQHFALFYPTYKTHTLEK